MKKMDKLYSVAEVVGNELNVPLAKLFYGDSFDHKDHDIKIARCVLVQLIYNRGFSLEDIMETCHFRGVLTVQRLLDSHTGKYERRKFYRAAFDQCQEALQEIETQRAQQLLLQTKQP